MVVTHFWYKVLLNLQELMKCHDLHVDNNLSWHIHSLFVFKKNTVGKSIRLNNENESTHGFSDTKKRCLEYMYMYIFVPHIQMACVVYMTCVVYMYTYLYTNGMCCIHVYMYTYVIPEVWLINGLIIHIMLSYCLQASNIILPSNQERM